MFFFQHGTSTRPVVKYAQVENVVLSSFLSMPAVLAAMM